MKRTHDSSDIFSAGVRHVTSVIFEHDNPHGQLFTHMVSAAMHELADMIDRDEAANHVCEVYECENGMRITMMGTVAHDLSTEVPPENVTLQLIVIPKPIARQERT